MSRAVDPIGRARRILARRGAWIEAVPAGYAVRAGTDRRARVLQVLDEGDFIRLAERPGLKARSGGGWLARPAVRTPPAPPPGRPGIVEGERVLMRSDGASETRRANLTSSPVAWLAARRDAEGRSWLTPAEVAAAERLGLDAEAALRGASTTMRWDALPRSGGARGPGRAAPDDRAIAASARVRAALAACGAARAIVERICIHATALQAAEQTLGLRRRTGKLLLRQGLQALARHYRLA